MKRILIGICDDELLILEQLKEMIESCARESGIDCVIQLFCSGAELLAAKVMPDVVFLDIEMPDIDGYETARRIKEYNPDCAIIMASGQVQQFKESFRIGALRFITKSFCREEVKEALDFFYQKIWNSDVVEMYLERVCYKIRQKDIVCFMAYDGYVECRTKSAMFRKNCSLQHIYQELDQKLFVKVSRSYIINVAYIFKISDGKVAIQDEIITVPRRNIKKLKEIWRRYDLNER